MDNNRKQYICVNPHDNHVYAKPAHFCWEKFDSDNERDLPSQRLNLAMENIGCEIILNASGSRDTTEVAAYFDKG